jgi:hypothetical protein
MTAALDINALIEAFAQNLADRVATKLAANTPSQWQPLAAVAERLDWTPRHLRDYCHKHGITIGGTRKAPLVDSTALDAALATAKPKSKVANLINRRLGK